MGLDDTAERVKRLAPRARTALLAESAGRVFPVYEQYWVGDYHPEVGRAIEVGWEYALGQPVDPDEHAKLLATVRDLVTYYYEEPTRIDLLAQTVTVVLRLLQSMTPDDEAAVRATVRGVYSAIDTAKSAEAHANQETPRPEQTDGAADEERAWQESALRLVEQQTGPITRDLFAPLGGRPPNWYADWLARSVR